MSIEELKREAYEANMELFRADLVLYTFGNVSAFDPDRGLFAIKPSGVPYPELTVQMMVVVDLEGTVVEGSLRPSSDEPTHRVLYGAFEGIRGITHTHSPYAVSWAQAQEPIPLYGTTHADHLCRDIPCTEVMTDAQIEGDYEVSTGQQIIRALEGLDPLVTQMVLVASHGPFSWGKDASKSVYHAVILESLARMAYQTRLLRPGTPRLKRTLVNKHHERKHGKSAYYGQEEKG